GFTSSTASAETITSVTGCHFLFEDPPLTVQTLYRTRSGSLPVGEGLVEVAVAEEGFGEPGVGEGGGAVFGFGAGAQ
ncbi:hypothetical protein, partial [Streptomyces sp. NPDC059003]|uniref:hypothetical protein n=1 Tax=Streptomyces sp. NPDC059003 TaxID=3346691 RepID=UPI0036AAC65D